MIQVQVNAVGNSMVTAHFTNSRRDLPITKLKIVQGLTRAGVIVSLRQSYIRGKGMVVVASSVAFLDSDSQDYLRKPA